jgi:hypothetical protein
MCVLNHHHSVRKSVCDVCVMCAIIIADPLGLLIVSLCTVPSQLQQFDQFNGVFQGSICFRTHVELAFL